MTIKLTHPKQKSSYERIAEVRFQRQNVRPDAGKQSTETRCFRREVCKRTTSYNAMRMVAKQVVAIRRQFGSLSELNRKEVAEVAPDLVMPQRLPAPASATATRCLANPVVVKYPRSVTERNEHQRREQQKDEQIGDNYRRQREQHRVEDDDQRLQPTFHRNRLRHELNLDRHREFVASTPLTSLHTR